MRVENKVVAMRKEPATRLLHLAQTFAAEPAGIGLDEIAAKFAVGRRTFDILARATISSRCLPHTSQPRHTLREALA